MFASLPGVSAPPPFGGNQRTLVVEVDPDRLRSYRLSPDDVVAALKAGNSISPSGNARIKDQMPIVPVNSMVRALEDLGSIPLRLGENIYLRDVAQIKDGTDIPMGHTLVNGRRAVGLSGVTAADVARSFVSATSSSRFVEPIFWADPSTGIGYYTQIQSFMGAIMAVGVATANAILLLTFAEENRKSGMSAADAAVEGAQSRLRPVLMTSFAMLAGMIPMALALAEGEEQSAPLGQAVIGGVIAATLATLDILPSIFSVLQRRAAAMSLSLDPDDAASRFFEDAGGAA